MRAAALVTAAVIGTVPSVALAGTYWVSPQGAAVWQDCEGTAPLDGAAACDLDTANLNVAAGDRVVLREGSYVDQWIEPAASGTDEDHRIVYAAHDGEQVVIQDGAYGIYLYKQSYVTVEGITFTNLRRFFRIYSGHYNVIHHCDFDGRSDESGDWSGAIIADDPNDDTDSSEDSTHNWVHHCTFYRWAWGAFDEHRGALLNIGNDQSAGDDSSFNLVEDSSFAY
ncbi:MAG: right-handed parallel beta-helix repeat-containing protein, partial [Deltaproteobacteria bacterium]|nr:right-handed parallel beta-helix repeat-containing protein [Deltaproteobacteria bacterium]